MFIASFADSTGQDLGRREQEEAEERGCGQVEGEGYEDEGDGVRVLARREAHWSRYVFLLPQYPGIDGVHSMRRRSSASLESEIEPCEARPDYRRRTHDRHGD